MRIKNETEYLTKDLKKIFASCVSELRKTEGSRVSRLKVSVVYHGNGANWIGGYAYMNSKTLAIKMPKRVKRSADGMLMAEKICAGVSYDEFWHRHERQSTFRPIFAPRIADVFIHEVGHCLGVSHRNGDTIEPRYTEWINQEFTDERYPVRLQSEVSKPKPDVRLLRHEKAKKNLAVAQTRFKRAKTLLTKWQAKVRYYDRILAVAETRKGEENQC